MITNPVTLLPDAELTREVTRMQRRAARKVEDARSRLRRELLNLAAAATREAERLDLEGAQLDHGGIRNVCDTRCLHELAAEVREAEMMAATVAVFIEQVASADFVAQELRDREAGQ